MVGSQTPKCVLPGSAQGRQYFCAPRFGLSHVPESARVSRVDDSESFRESRTSSFRSKSESDGEIHEVRFGATPKPARQTRALPTIIRAAYGLGDGLGRGLGVVCGLAVGVGLGVGVGLPEAVAVAVAVGLAVAVAVGVDVAVAVAVAVAVGVTVAVGLAVGVGVGVPAGSLNA